MPENYATAKITTECCGYYYVGVIPLIRSAELECPKCGGMNTPHIEYVDE